MKIVTRSITGKERKETHEGIDMIQVSGIDGHICEVAGAVQISLLDLNECKIEVRDTAFVGKALIIGRIKA